MVKIRLDAHPSVIIAHCHESGKFLFSVYDQSYPKTAYRGSANNIGGNPEAEDIYPENILIREVCEEFNPSYTGLNKSNGKVETILIKDIAREFDPAHGEYKKCTGKVKWAPDSDIRMIRNNLLANLQPLQDFLVKQEDV